MANKIRFRRGIKAQLPALSQGEPGFCTDTGGFYIGNTGGNVEFPTKSWVDSALAGKADLDPPILYDFPFVQGLTNHGTARSVYWVNQVQEVSFSLCFDTDVAITHNWPVGTLPWGLCPSATCAFVLVTGGISVTTGHLIVREDGVCYAWVEGSVSQDAYLTAFGTFIAK